VASIYNYDLFIVNRSAANIVTNQTVVIADTDRVAIRGNCFAYVTAHSLYIHDILLLFSTYLPATNFKLQMMSKIALFFLQK